MKKTYEMYLFIGLQICLALAYIYKESTYIGAFYQYQTAEKKYDDLVSQEKNLNHHLQELKNRSAIQKYAQKIGLEAISLEDVRQLNAQQPT